MASSTAIWFGESDTLAQGREDQRGETVPRPVLRSVNSYRGETTKTDTAMTNDEVDSPIEPAQDGVATWGSLPFEQRATLLRRAVRLCRERLEELARLMAMEVEDQINRSVADGAQLVIGGKPPAPEGAFIEPTLLTYVRTGVPAYDEELSGPVGSVIAVADEATAIEIADETRYGLGGSVDTRGVKRGRHAAGQTA
jgi:acyl-CoA reductase-like NAD-dependent aldehyde dehydrogenase